MYADGATGLSRRDMMKRGLALIGAAVGVNAMSKVEPAALAEVVTVLGRDFHLTGTSGSGPMPRRGDAAIGSGSLLSTTGEPIGSFHASRVTLDRVGAVGVEAPVAIEWHTLRLPGGTIYGTGAASHSVDHADAYAIIGGTGRYVGATGSYIAYLRHRELGGDGTAEFSITVLKGRF